MSLGQRVFARISSSQLLIRQPLFYRPNSNSNSNSNRQRNQQPIRFLHQQTMADSNSTAAVSEQAGEQPTPAGGFVLKTPKGMRDIGPAQAWQRKRVFEVITRCFELHGAQPIDTPVCERREILAGNYGEESKLIYNLEDQGGESLSLRYDLTVPFARYLGQNKIQTMTRYQVAKVYRRDNPSINKGRFREFYQCDIDFAGKYDVMMADAECLEILCEILGSVNLPHQFKVKINHRAVLNGLFQVAGVPEAKFKPICSSIDKLDKMSWEEVRREMCVEKGLDEKVADVIGGYVSRSGHVELVEELLKAEFGQNEEAKRGLEELQLLYRYAERMGIQDKLSFDLSLARGLDYYTGLIFEAVVVGEVEVGSVAAGGRYDNLVSSLLKNPGFSVPCVGLSIGVERIFSILEAAAANSTQEASESQIHCVIGSIGKDMSLHRYKIANHLRQHNIRVKNLLKETVKPLVLYQTCEKENVPYAILFGPKDIENNLVTVRNMTNREDEKISIDQLGEALETKLNLKTTNK